MKIMGFLAIALVSSVGATSVSKVERGYISVGSESSSYLLPSHQNQGKVHRYLYAAFQSGVSAGNLQVNHQGTSFVYDPGLNHSYLLLAQPGYSQLDVYFQKDSRYSLRTATFSILEKLVNHQIGKLRIDVNGNNLISNHSARSWHRFEEETWDISRFCVDGLNHVRISVQGNGSSYALLGVKVETDEVFSQAGGDAYANLQFVNRTFQNYHRRFPTSEESEYYTGLLNRMEKTRVEVEEMIRTLSQTEDSYTLLVEDYFLKYAGRTPTVHERTYYVEKLRNNQITLAQLKTECERLKGSSGNDTVQVDNTIRRMFYEVLRRYPTEAELSYYREKLNSGSLSWDQFRRELVAMKDGNSYGDGLTLQEVMSFGFHRSDISMDFWKKVERSSDQVLKEFIRRANWMQMHSMEPEQRSVAQIIRDRIYSFRPSLR